MFYDIFCNFARMKIEDGKRIDELDWLKAVCIILMVMFHVVFIEQQFPVAKHVVYVFHMPVFLLISGFVMRRHSRTLKEMAWSTLGLALPYLVMESAYIIAASVLPINEHIDNLTVLGFVERLFVHPIGPYWFLHTLIILSVLNYAFAKLCQHRRIIHYILFTATAYLLSLMGVVSFFLALYYLAGVVVRTEMGAFNKAFYPNPFAVLGAMVMVVLLCDIMEKENLFGILFNVIIVDALIYVYRFLPGKVRSAFLFIGRNTLPILLFSPLFTLLAKYYQPTALLPALYSLYPTLSTLLFLLVATSTGVYGSILIKWTMEKLRIARFLFLRKV